MNVKQSVFAVVTMLGLAVYADPVATVTKSAGSTDYDDLREAIAQCTDAGHKLDLLRDVDLTGVDWEPVNFKGQFDGHGYAISNLSVSADSDYAGFFRIFGASDMRLSAIKNLTFVNAEINASGRQYVGVVAGSCVGNISNVTVRGTIVVNGEKYVGGIAGHSYGSIYDCAVNGVDSSVSSIAKNEAKGYEVGGIVGLLPEGNYVVMNCTAQNLSLYASKSSCGGIVGRGLCSPNVIGCTVEDVVIVCNGAEETCGKIVGETHPGSASGMHYYFNNTALNTMESVNQIYGASVTNLDYKSVVGTDVIGYDYSNKTNWIFSAGTFVLYGVTEEDFAKKLVGGYEAVTTPQCDGSVIIAMSPDDVAKGKIYIDCNDSQARFSGVDRMQVVKAGDSIVFGVEPKAGYRIDGVYINGEAAESQDGSYTYEVTGGDVDSAFYGAAQGVSIRIVSSAIPGPGLEYPAWLDEAPDEYKGKFDDWADEFKVVDRVNASEDAFLLNCDEDDVEMMKIAFRIISIKVLDDDDVEIGLPDVSKYNGVTEVRGSETLYGPYELEEHAKAARFYKAYLYIPVKKSK